MRHPSYLLQGIDIILSKNKDILLKVIHDYNHKIPPNKKFKNGDIVKNIGNTLTRGCYYVVVDSTDRVHDYFNNRIVNTDGTQHGYILIRLGELRYNEIIETELYDDFLIPTGINIFDLLKKRHI